MCACGVACSVLLQEFGIGVTASPELASVLQAQVKKDTYHDCTGTLPTWMIAWKSKRFVSGYGTWQAALLAKLTVVISEFTLNSL